MELKNDDVVGKSDTDGSIAVHVRRPGSRRDAGSFHMHSTSKLHSSDGLEVVWMKTLRSLRIKSVGQMKQEGPGEVFQRIKNWAETGFLLRSWAMTGLTDSMVVGSLFGRGPTRCTAPRPLLKC